MTDDDKGKHGRSKVPNEVSRVVCAATGKVTRTKIPDFLIELSRQMNSQPGRWTCHPFWQVRCKRLYVTKEGYREHHFELVEDFDDHRTLYRSDVDDISVAANYFWDHHDDHCRVWCLENFVMTADFISTFDIDDFDLPDGIVLLHMQEVEEVVWTGLTESAALAFIDRKQHDYPKLYTYVESAYWSPQLRELQDWIKSLTSGVE